MSNKSISRHYLCGILFLLTPLTVTSCTHKPTSGTVFGYRYGQPQQPPTDGAGTKNEQKQPANYRAIQPDFVEDRPTPINKTLGPNNEPQVVVLSVVDITPTVTAPTPGKPGFVQSPYMPQAGLIDIRGYPPGTEVRDPYSGKTFLVPFSD